PDFVNWNASERGCLSDPCHRPRCQISEADVPSLWLWELPHGGMGSLLFFLPARAHVAGTPREWTETEGSDTLEVRFMARVLGGCPVMPHAELFVRGARLLTAAAVRRGDDDIAVLNGQ